MPFPLAPHHVQLINSCYPPASALVAAGPDYKPNSQEVSRLAYYASNRPGKIAKLASDLEKRALGDARKAAVGNARSRASLIITLNIYKVLIEECRRDLALLSSQLMSALDAALSSLTSDLEVCAKVASVFTAWATFTNGNLLGVDQVLTRNYHSVLRRFSSMCRDEDKVLDHEMSNRKRMVGLSVLTAAVASEALYNSSSQFKTQVLTIVPSLYFVLHSIDLSILDRENETDKRDNVALNRFLSDFRSRPLLERRAASIHMHVDGEEGPSDGEVAHTALRALACLLSQSNGFQVSLSVQALLDSLGMNDGWGDKDRCCWVCQKSIEWIQYQYRYIVPMRLVDRLLEAQEDPVPSDLHKTLAAMIKAAFTAPVPLANLSTSDICASLMNLLLRRIAINPEDPLLPDTVACVGTLGTHIYYADQIHDLACEIIGRLSSVESSGLGDMGRAYGTHERKREMALRCLIACLGQLIERSLHPLHRSPMQNEHHPHDSQIQGDLAHSAAGASTSIDAERVQLHSSQVQRTKISPEVWQETLSLLCDENFSVRSDYSRVLILYIKTEIQQEPAGHPNGANSLTHKGPFHHDLGAAGFGENATCRFLNALHAALYVLATAPRLGLPPTSSTPTPSHSYVALAESEVDPSTASVVVNVTPSTPMPGQSFTDVNDIQEPDTSQNRRRSIGTNIAPRKACRIRRILEWPNGSRPIDQQPGSDTSACLTDYAQMLQVLEVTHEHSATRSLLTGIPMLLTLRSWCESKCSSDHRKAAVDEVLCRQWRTLARIWDLGALEEIAPKHTLSEAFPYPPPNLTFPEISSASPLSALPPRKSELGDLSLVPAILSKVDRIQAITGLDEAGLKEKLSIPWSPENALQASVESSERGSGWRSGNVSPRLKITPGLMHISNLSLQSLNRSNRGVGVSDLRDALEGRHGMSNLALHQDTAPSVASLGFSASAASGESFSPSTYSVSRAKSPAFSGDGPKDVKNVLDKLGIGSPTSPSRSPLSLPPSKPQSTYLIPPYKG